MDCEKFMSMLDRYADLTEIELAQLNEHTLNCSSCKAELEFLQSIINSTHSLPPIEPPTNFLDSVNERLDKTLAKESGISVLMRRARPYINRYGTIAACLAVGIVIGANGDMLVSRMNGDTDGVIESKSVVSDFGTTPENSDNLTDQIISPVEEPAIPQDNSKVLSTVPAAVSSTNKTIQPSADKNTVFASPSSTVVSSEQTSVPTKTDASATAKPAESETAVSSINEAASTAAPLDVHISTHVSENTAVQTSAPTETPVSADRPVGYSIRMIEEPDNTPDAYAQAEIDVAAEYSIATTNPENDGTYAATPLSSTIMVNEADAERAKLIIMEYVESVYGNYYMTTGDKLYNLTRRLENEGIWYYANLTDRGSKVSFKLLVK